MNCPNCGAPIISAVCEYCGTRHWEFESKIREMEREIKLIKTSAKQIERQMTLERLYEEVIDAMRKYSKGE